MQKDHSNRKDRRTIFSLFFCKFFFVLFVLLVFLVPWCSWSPVILLLNLQWEIPFKSAKTRQIAKADLPAQNVANSIQNTEVQVEHAAKLEHTAKVEYCK